MTPLQEVLSHIGDDAHIIKVEVDRHEHRDTCKCEICKQAIVWRNDDICDGEGTILAPVAQITFVADGYAPGGEVLSENDEEWPVTCQNCILEAVELEREHLRKSLASAPVSIRGAALRLVDEKFENVAQGVA